MFSSSGTAIDAIWGPSGTWPRNGKIIVAGDFWPLCQGGVGSFPMVLVSVLWCFMVFYGVLRWFGSKNWCYGRFGVLFRGRYLGKTAQNHRCR